jgi:protein-S-isoprenylcysteine O-methyltransferase Ste14
MLFNAPTLATIGLLITGIILSTPVLYKGFSRRGKGVVYEQDYSIQRAPQMATLANVVVIFLAFMAANNLIIPADMQPLLTLAHVLSPEVSQFISWLGVLIFMSGLVFMIGGWYSLGDMFTTDAEVLEGQTVRKNGLLSLVMHPAYSGIIQSCLGTSLAAVSLPAALIAVAVVGALWLRRAKYEEKILIESLGPEYKQYGEDMKWRRLVPRFIPIGV